MTDYMQSGIGGYSLPSAETVKDFFVGERKFTNLWKIAIVVALAWTIWAIVIAYEAKKSPFAAAGCDCPPPVLSASALALSNKFGQCMSGTGQDTGIHGGCGAAEAFAATPQIAKAVAARGSQDVLQKLKEGFLSTRVDAPQSGGDLLTQEYWNAEVANPGSTSGLNVVAAMGDNPDAMSNAQAAADGAAQAIAAVQAGSISAAAAPAVAAQAAAASSFRSSRSSFADRKKQSEVLDDVLGAVARG